MTEDQVQIAVMQWANLINYKDKKLADYIHHSPNGGKRHIATATRFKKMGTKKGYPDLIVDIAQNGYHGLRIELKKGKGCYASKEQKERLKMLNDEGYLAVVCKGLDEAIEAIKSYMVYVGKKTLNNATVSNQIENNSI